MKKLLFKLSEMVIKIYTILCILSIISAVMILIEIIFVENQFFDIFFEIMLKIFSPDFLGGKRGGIIEFVADIIMFYKVYTLKNSDDTKSYNKTVMLAVLGFVESLVIFFGLPDMRYF